MTRALVAALALTALAGTGCVAKSDYLRKEAEAAQYKKDWEDELAKARQEVVGGRIMLRAGF